MTTSQVARLLGVSTSTIRRWVKDGQLRPITPANPLLRRPKSPLGNCSCAQCAGKHNPSAWSRVYPVLLIGRYPS